MKNTLTSSIKFPSLAPSGGLCGVRTSSTELLSHLSWFGVSVFLVLHTGESSWGGYTRLYGSSEKGRIQVKCC